MAAPVLASVLASGALSGCANQGDDATGPVSAPPTNTTSPASGDDNDGTDGTDGSGAPSSPATSATTSAGPSGGALASALLGADRLPGFTASARWQEQGTSNDEGDELIGACHRFAMLSIGAMKVVRRDYASSPDRANTSASQLVAEFPDTKTAKRAYAVLSSWHDKCLQTLADNGHTDPTVGSLTPVTTSAPDSTATWYVVSFGPTTASTDPAAVVYDAEGFVRSGDRISVVVLRTEGTTFDYPDGEEPPAIATQRAAELL